MRPPGPPSAGIGPAPENLKALQARQLLASLINHPSILAEVGEDLASLRLTGRDLERLRKALLDTVAGRPDLDSDGLKCHLCERGFAAVLDRLLHQSVYRLAQFARPEASVSEVRAAVAHILGLYRERLVKGDIVEAEAELAQDPTAEKLARLKARQELIHDGESRRVDLERADGTLGGDVVN